MTRKRKDKVSIGNDYDEETAFEFNWSQVRSISMLSPLRDCRQKNDIKSETYDAKRIKSTRESLFYHSSPLSTDERSEGKIDVRGHLGSSSRKQVTFEGSVLHATTERRTKNCDWDDYAQRYRDMDPCDSGSNENGEGTDDCLLLSHTSSSFELAEKGASKVLIDSVQFHLDGLFARNASITLRRRSAWDLFELCHSKESTCLFRSNSIMRVLVRVIGLLLTEEDEEVELTIIALATLCVQRMNRTTTISLPRNSFQALIVCALDGKFDIRQSIRESIFGKPSEETRNILINEKLNGSGNIAYVPVQRSADSRIKRRFSRHKSLNDNMQCLKRTLVLENSDIGNSNHGVMLKKLAILLPKIHKDLCLMEEGVSIGETSQALSLFCVSNFLMSKAQACTSIGSGYGRLNAISPFRGGDKDTEMEALRDCQQALFEKPLGSTSSNHESSRDVGYLQLCAKQLIKSMQQGTSLTGIRALQVWQWLGVLHASCYRHADNQSILCRPIPCNTQEIFFPVEVFRFFMSFAPKVVSHIANEMHQFNATKDIRSSRTGAGADTSRLAKPNGDRELNDLVCHEFIDNDNCGYQDLFMASLQTLVNLTHGNSDASKMILEQDMASSLVRLVSFFNSNLCTLRSHEKTLSSSQNGERIDSFSNRILSPNEDPVENVLFGTTLNLVLLLTNLVDSVPDAAEVALRGNSIPPWLSAHMYEESVSMSRLITGILTSSSESFMEDLSKSEERKHSFVYQSLDSLRPNNACHTSVPSSISHDSAITPDKERCSINAQSDDTIPVADIVLSAYACMLLLVLGCPNRPKAVDVSQQSNENAIESVTCDSALQKSAFVRAFLPKNSWWLPTRTLKAFLALQNGTGIFLCDNIVQVLEAIRVMELQDNAVESADVHNNVVQHGIAAIVTPFSGGTPIEHSQVSSKDKDDRSSDWLNEKEVFPAKNEIAKRDLELLKLKLRWNGSDLVTSESPTSEAMDDQGPEPLNESYDDHTEASDSSKFKEEETAIKLGHAMACEWPQETSFKKNGRKFGRR